MAFPQNGTKLAQMVNPQVLADMIDKKLVDLIKFAPLCTIDNTLVGRAGNTVTLPCYAYIGDATDVNEGADIPISQLTTSTKTVTVKKAGKGVQLTDEALLSGYGDPMGQTVYQVALAIASKVDNDILGILHDITGAKLFECSGSTATADNIADALVKFGEDIDGDKVILVSPAQYSALRKADDWLGATDIAGELIIKGAVGMIHGCQVVVSNKLATTGDLYIVKPDAIRIYMKRDTLVETDRDIINKSNVVTADKHYVGYLYDESKAIRMSVNFNGLSVSAESQSTTILGKSVSDLQTDVVVGNEEVTGTLKYVTGYTGYSGEVSEQSGNYLAIKVDCTDFSDSVVKASTIKNGVEGTAVAFDSDKNLVLRLVDKDTTLLKIVATKGTAVTTRIFKLDGLTCNAE